MGLLIAFLGTAMGAGEMNLPDSYVLRVAKAMEACRQDIPAMQPVAETVAQHLAAGGKFWAAGQPSMVNELTGRAGGFMMLKSLGQTTPGEGDVVLFFPGEGIPAPGGSALVVTFGQCPAAQGGPCFDNHAKKCGISPTMANAIPGWIFTGEVIAALTRLGKMPVIFESIGAYSGNARITQYKSGEIPFHEDMKVPPVAHGVIGNRFVDIITGMLNRVEREQRGNLDRAGAWAREAKAQHKQLFMYSMGHLFPDEVGKTIIGTVFRSGVWNAGFRCPKPQDNFNEGDFITLIGYQHPPDDLLQKARPAGVRVVYTAVFADRDFVRDPGVIWIDPMWNWPDACTPLEGYDVPLLAASGIVNGAIAWEIYRLTIK